MLIKFPEAYLLIGSDFNITLDNTPYRWPPGSRTRTADTLKASMHRYYLVAAWRAKYPNDRGFAWSNRSRSQLSRTDM